MRRSPTSRTALVLAVSALVLGACASSPRSTPIERFSGTIADVADAMPGTTAPIVITINSYTSDEEVRRLAQILAEKGQAGLRDATAKTERGWVRIGDEVRDATDKNGWGWVRIGDEVGYPVAAARSRPTDTGRRISVLINRPITFFEVWRAARSRGYPFSIVRLDLDAQGEGTGELMAAAKVEIEDGMVEIEDLGFQPVKLLKVRASQP